ncbi:MAG: transcriptional regulator [Lachnospiraceae bacterium]|nr:transcriptional regulator [Lachnospiraceae bacterium]
MTKEETLKNEILKKYKSLRQFCIKLDIPYSTLMTALERGIDGMAYGTVMKMCEDLMLNPIDFSVLSRKSTSRNAQLYQHQLQKKILKLNKKGITRLIDTVEDLLEIQKYTTED